MAGFVFEACVDSVYSALQAEKGGAGRLELCSSLSEGGITPSYGLIKLVSQQTKIPVHVLVRPRSGDFCYDQSEVDVILADVHALGNLGVQGVVFGALTVDGDIDVNLVGTVMLLCKQYGFDVTFHRAFDATRNPFEALKTLVELGIRRVLTSGHRKTVDEGLPLLKELVANSAKRISIMPGGGVSEANAATIVRTLRVTELHGSASSPVKFGASFGDANPEIQQAMTGGRGQRATNSMIVAKIVSSCNELIAVASRILDHSSNSRSTLLSPELLFKARRPG